jgi:hypothetical protein
MAVVETHGKAPSPLGTTSSSAFIFLKGSVAVAAVLASDSSDSLFTVEMRRLSFLLY